MIPLTLEVATRNRFAVRESAFNLEPDLMVQPKEHEAVVDQLIKDHISLIKGPAHLDTSSTRLLEIPNRDSLIPWECCLDSPNQYMPGDLDPPSFTS